MFRPFSGVIIRLHKDKKLSKHMTVRPNGIPCGNYRKQNYSKKSPKTIKSKAKNKNKKLEKNSLISEAALIWSA
jgi:hypothetical protein